MFYLSIGALSIQPSLARLLIDGFVFSAWINYHILHILSLGCRHQCYTSTGFPLFFKNSLVRCYSWFRTTLWYISINKYVASWWRTMPTRLSGAKQFRDQCWLIVNSRWNFDAAPQTQMQYISLLKCKTSYYCLHQFLILYIIVWI